MPADLVPLPTAPYDERPLELALDRDECRTALWRCRGNVTKAAELLKVAPNRLRSFINASAFLAAEQREAQEQLLDIAEDIMYQALTDEVDAARRDQMARFVATNLGGSRGYGNGKGGVNLSLNTKKGTLVVSWEDGTGVVGNDNGEEAKVIDHE